VGVLLRLLFDALFWARHLPEGRRSRPLLVVLEEAHAYLNAANDGAASMAARRIVKEGRKYGLSAMIVSQRPSEIDPTILSQCGTMFALRLANASDRSQVTGTVTDNLEGCSTCFLLFGRARQLSSAKPFTCRCVR
jgi:DNA helicase HerA-like ATPase